MMPALVVFAIVGGPNLWFGETIGYLGIWGDQLHELYSYADG
jgi:hypothetical protein